MSEGGKSRGASLPAIAERFRGGDVGALGDLVDLYGVRLKGFCRVILGSAEVAEEVVQEVFLKAWESRHQLRDPAKVEAWLFTLARHRALRVAQRASHHRESATDPEVIASMDLQEDGADARGSYLHEEAAMLLQTALGSLDPKKRDLLSLRYFSELSFAEIAEVLDMPIGSVGTLISRALGTLRKHFEGMGLKKDDLLP